MGLLGLRKFIDSCGCTRLLPVPLSDVEAEEEGNRRLRVGGQLEIAGEGGGLDSHVQYLGDRERGEEGNTDVRSSRRRHLTSSSHVIEATSASAAADGNRTPMADHVLVDMNCIVHSCFHHQSSENKTKKQLIQEVLERLRVLVTEVVVPRLSLSLCFDGPAPIAKLQTQRLRRRKVSLLDTGSAQQLNTLSITAGSLFMIELENAIASQFKLNHGCGFLRRACPVYLYGTTVMGEGEAKISRALAFLAYGSACAGDDSVHASQGEEKRRTGRDIVNAEGRGKIGVAGGDYQRNNQAGAREEHSSQGNAANALSLRCRPDDSVVVMGNDIDLVVTCLGATAFHNFSIISPSSLQLIRVSDILYLWLKATSATRGDTPFSASQLPSIRIDFVFLFLLNGGDHYTGAGEVAMGLWRRYRSVRAAYPHSTLISPNLDAVDIDFFADVVQASEYAGSSSIEVGMDLLQSALWSLHTVVTGVCPDYHFIPAPAAPQLCHLRAAAAHCQRTNTRIRLPNVNRQSQPLTPLETYVALMPTEATLPQSIVKGLHSKAAHRSVLRTLETSNDTAAIARAAKEAVEISAPWLTRSEEYLRQFTSPVLLNANPPRRRLSRHEQHRMMKTHGHIQLEDPVPVVRPVTMPENVPYLDVPYPPQMNYLDFHCPFDVATAQSQETDEDASDSLANGASGGSLTHLRGRAVSTRPTLFSTAVTPQRGKLMRTSGARGSADDQHSSNGSAGRSVEHKRVYINQEAAADEVRQRERNSASAKLQRTLEITSGILERGQHFTTPQQRRMHRRLHRLQQAEAAELRSTLAREDRKYAARIEKGQTNDLESELRQFLGDDVPSEDVAALMSVTPDDHAGARVASRCSARAGRAAAGKQASTRPGAKNHPSRGVVVATKALRQRDEKLDKPKTLDLGAVGNGSLSGVVYYEGCEMAPLSTSKERGRRIALASAPGGHARVVEGPPAGFKRRRDERVDHRDQDGISQRTLPGARKHRRATYTD